MSGKKFSVLSTSFMLAISIVVTLACSSPSAPASAPKATPSPSPTPAPAGPAIVLNYLFPFPKTMADAYMCNRWIEEVDKRSKGQLTLKYIGSDAIASADGLGSTNSGAVDMATTIVGNSEKLMGVFLASMASPFSYEEEAKLGIPDFWRKMFAEKMNVHYFGTANKGHGWGVFLKKPLTKIEEMEGRKIVLGPAAHQQGFMQALKAVPVGSGAPPDNYTYVQQGIADGSFFTVGYFASLKEWEVAPYFINQEVWGGSALFTVVNMSKWNSLPKNLQDMMMQIQTDLQPEVNKYMLADDQASIQKYTDNKVTLINLSPSDSELFKKASIDAIIGAAKSKVDAAIWAGVEKVYNNFKP
jgi:TRAP-type C4-dicarboxylate transport system substrate-binding protein